MGDTNLWVAVAFVAFLLILFKLGAHRAISGGLDRRAERIRTELDEARQLREEAHKLLAEYQRKRREAEEEATAIVSAARSEAERLAVEAKAKAEDYVARRTKAAEMKIAQAEAQAVAEVRAAAADAAIAAAENILGNTVKGKTSEALIDAGLKEAKARLN